MATSTAPAPEHPTPQADADALLRVHATTFATPTTAARDAWLAVPRLAFGGRTGAEVLASPDAARVPQHLRALLALRHRDGTERVS